MPPISCPKQAPIIAISCNSPPLWKCTKYWGKIKELIHVNVIVIHVMPLCYFFLLKFILLVVGHAFLLWWCVWLSRLPAAP